MTKPTTSPSGSATSSIIAAYSPNGRYIATWSTAQGLAHFWDTSSYKLLKELRGHEDPRVFHGEFNPDGTILVTSGQDGTARLWAVPTGELLHVLRGHGEQVHIARFSPDGNWLVTCSTDGTARLWNLSSGELTGILPGHSAPVWDAAFMPDSSLVATAGQDAVVRFHQLRPAQTGSTLILDGEVAIN